MKFDLFTYLLAQQNGGGGTGGSGINYKSMTINGDNTITIVDLEDTEHTLVPTFTDNVITAITYDGKNVKLTYDENGNLIKIGDSDVDLTDYTGGAEAVLAELLSLVTPQTQTINGCITQLDSDRDDLADNLVTMGVAASHSETITELVPKVLTIPSGSNIGYEVKFKVDGNDYYVAQCLQGESITKPPSPTKAGETFLRWQLNGNNIAFPYTPSADVELNAYFENITLLQYLLTDTSGQYIDTNYKTQENTKYVIEFEYTALNFLYTGVFGTRGESNTSNVQENAYISNGSNNYVYVGWGNNNVVDRSNSIYANNKYRATLQKYYYRIENLTNPSSYGGSIASNTVVTNRTVYLFGINSDWIESNLTNPATNLKIYSFKIYEGDDLVHDFVPILDSNSTPCMVDLITLTKFYNAGSGTFLYG